MFALMPRPTARAAVGRARALSAALYLLSGGLCGPTAALAAPPHAPVIIGAALMTTQMADRWHYQEPMPVMPPDAMFPQTVGHLWFCLTYTGTGSHDTYDIALLHADGRQLESIDSMPFHGDWAVSGDATECVGFDFAGTLAPGRYRAVLRVDGRVVRTLPWAVAGVAAPVPSRQTHNAPSRQTHNAPSPHAATGYGTAAALVGAIVPRVLRVDVALPHDQQGTGTAFVVRSDATGTYLLTAAHVLAGATVAGTRVRLPGGGSYPTLSLCANGASSGTGDLAVVRIARTVLRPLAFAGGPPASGQTALVIGYALGLDGPPTVTTGVVSAVNRDLGDGSGPVWLQHTGPLWPGDSGSPLLNDRGEVLGVNVAGLGSAGGQGEGASAIDVAIPAALARPLADHLVARCAAA